MPAKSFPRGNTRSHKAVTALAVGTLALAAGWSAQVRADGGDESHHQGRGQTFDDRVRDNAIEAFKQGRRTFRFDTFGDQDFWGGKLQLHRAIEGEQFGGVGPGISPNTALSLGRLLRVRGLVRSRLRMRISGGVAIRRAAVVWTLRRLRAARMASARVMSVRRCWWL